MPPTWYDVFVAEKIGIYIRDIYEFNGFQFLGLWTKTKTFGKAEAIGLIITASGDDLGEKVTEGPALETAAVFNEDFRKWRDTYNKGGDFYIFSDVEWIDPPAPTTIMLGPSQKQTA